MGPPVSIALSGGQGWRFDETKDTQRFEGAVVVQDVALTVRSSSLVEATVNGAAATFDTPTAAIARPLGELVVPVVLTAAGGLSKTYRFVFECGLPKEIAQAGYGKPGRPASIDAFGSLFGGSVALSGDTLAVGAPNDGSGINGNPYEWLGQSSGVSGALPGGPRGGTSEPAIGTGCRPCQRAYVGATSA